MPVPKLPGSTSDTAMPSRPTSIRNASVIASSACFPAQYQPMSGNETRPASEDMLTMRPSPRDRMPGTTSRAPQVLVQRPDAALPLPAYAHPGDAGADLVAAEDVTLAPGERAVVPTGLAIALPEGYAAFVHPRSGLAARAGLALVNAPGTVDAGYRGEIKVIVVNLDPREPIHLARGDRIAQLLIQRVEAAEFVEVAELPGSARGAGGH